MKMRMMTTSLQRVLPELPSRKLLHYSPSHVVSWQKVVEDDDDDDDGDSDDDDNALSYDDLVAMVIKSDEKLRMERSRLRDL
jgi:hypothetical protein